MLCLNTKRFRLGVGLAKLGLFDLSMRHVSLSATPWEAPLYRLRARLMFPPVHASLRTLAQSVREFEMQAETELLKPPPRSSQMATLCNSLTECALALQSLPLLNLAGYSSPRNGESLALGHSPVALPVLLSEVFSTMCPPLDVPHQYPLPPLPHPSLRDSDIHKAVMDKSHSARSLSPPPIRIGVLAGSFDGLPGRIVVGQLRTYDGSV